MTFKIIYDPAKRPTLPQCEAMRVTTYANDAPDKDYRCLLGAHYVVGSKDLCSKHAGAEILRLLKDEGYQLTKGEQK